MLSAQALRPGLRPGLRLRLWLPATFPRQRALASTGAPPPSAGRVLEQPDRYRPPSHPAAPPRRDSGPINYPGRRLSAEEQERMRKKRYPNMFPSEGTRMHWFLTTWWIHFVVVLVGLGDTFRSRYAAGS